MYPENVAPTPAPVAPVEPVAPVAPTPAPQPAPLPTPEVGIGLAPNHPPVEPTPAPVVPEPVAPVVEPVAPVTEPSAVPTQNAPTNVAPTENKPQLTYDQYLESLTKDIPAPVDLPKPTEIDAEDPEGLAKFFDKYAEAIVQRAAAKQQGDQLVQRAEQQAWQNVFTKYPEIQSNAALRDTVHNIRMGAYQRGESLSPLQVADALVGTLHTEYKKGVNDTNVQVSVRESQPLNGGGQPVAAPAVNYEAIQLPGQAGTDAAVAQIEAMIAAGKV